MDTKNSAFRDLKLYIEELIPLDRDYLHILVGAMLFAIYFVWTIVQRKRIRAHEAIGTVLFIAVVGELLDIHDDILEHEHPDIAESLKDIILTASVPIAVVFGRVILRKAIVSWRNFQP